MLIIQGFRAGDFDTESTTYTEIKSQGLNHPVTEIINL